MPSPAAAPSRADADAVHPMLVEVGIGLVGDHLRGEEALADDVAERDVRGVVVGAERRAVVDPVVGERRQFVGDERGGADRVGASTLGRFARHEMLDRAPPPLVGADELAQRVGIDGGCPPRPVHRRLRA